MAANPNKTRFRARMSPTGRKRARLWIPLAAVMTAFTFLTAGFYDSLTVVRQELFFSELSQAFNGFKIMLLADLHSHSFGAGQADLLAEIKSETPDMIVLCGDVINRTDTVLDNVEILLDGLVALAPVYAVPGNHELDNPVLFARLVALYRQKGVIYLDGEIATIQREGQELRLHSGKIGSNNRSAQWLSVGKPDVQAPGFDLLLYHFGNEFAAVSSLGYDLVLAGHVHGGLIRLFGKGLFEPSGHFFPPYDKGVFEENGCVMVLSGGLGDSVFPRFYNRREAVSVILRAEDSSAPF